MKASELRAKDAAGLEKEVGELKEKGIFFEHYDLPGAGLFRFISFRAGVAMLFAINASPRALAWEQEHFATRAF